MSVVDMLGHEPNVHAWINQVWALWDSPPQDRQARGHGLEQHIGITLKAR